MPDGAHEVDHVKPDHGAEYWVYRTSQSGRDVAKFYEDEGGSCRYTSTQNPATPGASYSVAQCSGKTEKAGVGFSWEVYIAEGYSENEGPTIFRIYKYGNDSGGVNVAAAQQRPEPRSISGPGVTCIDG